MCIDEYEEALRKAHLRIEELEKELKKYKNPEGSKPCGHPY